MNTVGVARRRCKQRITRTNFNRLCTAQVDMSGKQKQSAAQFKTQGNKLYGEHRFEAAYKAYSEAAKLDESDPTFYANQAAVLFEAGLYHRCIDACDVALSKVDHHSASTDLRQRLNLRKAKSLFFDGKFEDAHLYMQQCPPQSSEEWNTLQSTVLDRLEHLKKCRRTENPPFAFNCSVPSIRGSLLPSSYIFDLPISHDIPTSLLQSSHSTGYPSLIDLSPLEGKTSIDLLFAQNTDPRHFIKTLTQAKSLYSSKSIDQALILNTYVLEPNPKILARFVLLLFVMGHTDLDDTRSHIASDFLYFLWIGVGLIPPHWTMLSETLHELCKLSFNLDTWRLDPRSAWIEVGDERDLKLVRDCWIMWGTATENQEDSKSALSAYISTLKAQSSTPIQQRYADIRDQSYRKISECSREADFFNQFRMVLPRPPMLEGDNQIPPKSMKAWMLNPTIDVSDKSLTAEGQKSKWIPEPRPDAIFPFGSVQPHHPPTSFSLYTHDQLFEAIRSIQMFRKANKLKIRALCGQLADLCDVGSRLGAIVGEEGLSFDRIHIGNSIESVSGLSSFIHASMLLMPSKSPHTAFYASLSDVTLRFGGAASSIGPYADMDHFLYNKLRMDRSQLESRFGWSVSRLNDNTLVWAISKSAQHPNRQLSDFDAFYKSNATYKTEYLVSNIFASCAVSVPTPNVVNLGLTDAKSYIEQGAPNLMLFVQFLNLLVLTGTPAHWISSSLDLIWSGSIRASILDTATQTRSTQKIRPFITTPFLMELKTLLPIVPGKYLLQAGSMGPRYENIDSCHWFQAHNLPIQNFPATVVYPHNPSLSALIIDKRIQFDDKLNLAERFATVFGREQFLSLLDAHSEHVNIITAVYWTGPPKISSPSQVTFGFWLPPSFLDLAIPTTFHSILLFRMDVFVCIGLTNLSGMRCTTGDE